MTRYCDHGHPLEDWMTECPYCTKASEGVRVVMGNTADPASAPTQVTPPGGLKATVVDGQTAFFRQPLKATIVDTPEKKTVVLAGAAPAERRRGDPRPLSGWLVIMSGPDKWKDFRVDRERVTIGSAEDCEIRIQDEGISSRHANVRQQPDGLFIVDLDSTNGTFINNETAPVAKRELHDEDLIRVGNIWLKFRKL